MPKLKSNRGAAKRFRVTGSGRVKCRRAYRSHILTKMSAKRKRQLRGTGQMSLDKSDVVEAKRLLNGS